MKRTNYILFLFSLILLLNACKDKTKLDIKKITGYDNECLKNGDGLNFKSFKIIPLEATRKSMLTNIQSLKIIDSLIIVQEDSGLLCFDLSGKYNYSYGARGKGPGEHINLSSYYYNKKENTINIMDIYKKTILTYKLTGEFVSSKKFKSNSFPNTYIAEFYRKDKILQVNYIYNKFNTIYSELDLSTANVRNMYSLPVESENGKEKVGENPISLYGKEIKMLIPFDNKIYKLKGDTIEPIYYIETKEEIVSQKKLQKIKNYSFFTYSNFMNKKKFYGFGSIFETQKYLFLGFNNYSFFLVDKSNNTGKRFNYYVDSKKGLNFLPILCIKAIYKDSFVGIVSNDKLKEYAENISDTNQNKNLRYFKNEVSKLTEDNYCLMIYDIK